MWLFPPALLTLPCPPPLTLPAPSPPCFRNLFDYDQVVNTQRDKIYAERRRAVLSADLTPLMVEYADKTVDDILEVCVCVGGGGQRGWRGARCREPQKALPAAECTQ